MFAQVAFDENTFNNFNFYDFDISMQIHKAGYSIVVVSDIIVNHFSGGSLNKQWLESAYLFYEKWKNELPVTVNPSLKKKPLTKEKTFRDLLYTHKKCGVPVPKETWKIGWRALKFRILTAYFLFIIKP
jgi:GT2 family glycosyltransferase